MGKLNCDIQPLECFLDRRGAECAGYFLDSVWRVRAVIILDITCIVWLD